MFMDNISPLFGQLMPKMMMGFADDSGAGAGDAGDSGDAGTGGDAGAGSGDAAPPSFAWKEKLGADFAKSPLVNKFDDSIEGLNNMVKSHGELERMINHEKVVVPKGPDDAEGWSQFSKAMGVPDAADQYELADVSIPDHMKGLAFDKQRFSEIMHAHKLTPGQAKGLWQAYTEMTMEGYNNALKSSQEDMQKVVNGLKGEWGDAYDAKVELGQMVINKFSADQETSDFLTAVLSQDPKGVKFLAKLGEQFQESKIGDFKYKNFTLSPEEAQAELASIYNDPKHPYNDPDATDKSRNVAIDRVNQLLLSIQNAQQRG